MPHNSNRKTDTLLKAGFFDCIINEQNSRNLFRSFVYARKLGFRYTRNPQVSSCTNTVSIFRNLAAFSI